MEFLVAWFSCLAIRLVGSNLRTVFKNQAFQNEILPILILGAAIFAIVGSYAASKEAIASGVIALVIAACCCMGIVFVWHSRKGR
ncbi:MAG: hypothetical protein UY09_C0037G0016 [Parcubacteria group bacterium GW2011_GWA2_47_8]|nr:MAG: hypothetical protein UY09_C0037G0016 [Parcubacteria group bacterium GW2011_GWA2_47_8]